MPFFPREFILDFLYMNPYLHKTILHSLANLDFVLYDVEGSTQEASVMKDCDGRKEANVNISIVVRNQSDVLPLIIPLIMSLLNI